MKLVGRAKAIMLTPEAEWPVIGQEKRSAYGLFVPYVAVLAAIPEVAHFIGQSLIGGYRPIGAGLLRALVVYLASFAIVYLVAVVIDVSAARFGGEKNFSNALKLSVYSHTPLWLAGIFLLDSRPELPADPRRLSPVDRAAAAHARAARARAAARHPGDGLRADSRGRALDRVARPDLSALPLPLAGEGGGEGGAARSAWRGLETCCAGGCAQCCTAAGAIPTLELGMIPGLQRIIPLRFMLRCARETPSRPDLSALPLPLAGEGGGEGSWRHRRSRTGKRSTTLSSTAIFVRVSDEAALLSGDG